MAQRAGFVLAPAWTLTLCKYDEVSSSCIYSNMYSPFSLNYDWNHWGCCFKSERAGEENTNCSYSENSYLDWMEIWKGCVSMCIFSSYMSYHLLRAIPKWEKKNSCPLAMRNTTELRQCGTVWEHKACCVPVWALLIPFRLCKYQSFRQVWCLLCSSYHIWVPLLIKLEQITSDSIS